MKKKDADYEYIYNNIELAGRTKNINMLNNILIEYYPIRKPKLIDTIIIKVGYILFVAVMAILFLNMIYQFGKGNGVLGFILALCYICVFPLAFLFMKIYFDPIESYDFECDKIYEKCQNELCYLYETEPELFKDYKDLLWLIYE